MLRPIAVLILLPLAACGSKSDEAALQDAANQSDPAAAAVLNNAAENGMDPQEALARAGRAQLHNDAGGGAPSGSLQAKPNLPNDPNRPEGGRPPAKVAVNSH